MADLGALELASLFRKYTNQLADIDLQESETNRLSKQAARDRRISRDESKVGLRDRMASQGLTHSGIALKEQVDLEKAYERAGADAEAQKRANLSRLAKQRLQAKSAYDEGVALSKMTSLLNKQAEALGA